MSELIESVGAWPLLVGVVLIYGVFPGVAARLISLCFRKDDPRRRELIAEVYAVPRWERPAWVGEQVERAVSEGLWERMYDFADGRIFNRWALGDGIARNAASPESFGLPDAEEIEMLEPGDSVKLMFEFKGRLHHNLGGCFGERMWVLVTKIGENTFEGTINNHPYVWNMSLGDTVKFERRHIIDCWYADPDEDQQHAVA